MCRIATMHCYVSETDSRVSPIFTTAHKEIWKTRLILTM